ncbi:MAG: twin-arginine translocase subunit TatC [Bacteroidales bacterium]|nr:twin-arginine translocase subunit TatC [Bacteroidales bacterium]
MSDFNTKSFWSHLEALRWVLVRCVCVVFGIAIAAFLLGDFIFDRIVFAPCSADFVTYRFFCQLAAWLSMPGICPSIEEINIININLTAQFFTHLSISFYIGLIIGFPYLIVEFWYFILPALYPHERKPALKGAVSFVVLFFVGVLTAYFLIFPLALNFLGTYQISESVPNQISLNSYISTFLTLIFMLGLVFEMPVVAYFLAKIGFLTSDFLTKYRKHSIVAILILAAFITPSSDIFTMFMVALPLQLLYELSRLVVKRVEKKSLLP